MIDRNCLSYWFPKLVDAAIPVPRTEIVTTDLELIRVLYGRPSGPDAEAFDAAYRAFLREVAHHADSIGFPCFLRTGQTSGKHEWKNTCFLPDAEQIMKSVPALIEFSALADMMGLRTNVWAIREYLPVEPVAVLPRYGDMPLVPEMRCFINKGEILCTHFYWPINAIARGLPAKTGPDKELAAWGAEQPFLDMDRAIELYGEIESLIDINHVASLASKVADVFRDDGYWSVDVLPARDMWYVTDMAEGERSFHWEGCKVRP